MFLGSEKTSNRIRATCARTVAAAGLKMVTSIKLRSPQKEIHTLGEDAKLLFS